MSIFAECIFEPRFCVAIAVEYLKKIIYEILSDVPSSNHQTFGAAPEHILVNNLVTSHD